MIFQECTTTMDRKMSADTFRFANAKMGKIARCSFDYIIKENKYDQIQIDIKNQSGYEQALRQATKQFGRPKEIFSGNYISYLWEYKQSNNIIIEVELKNNPVKKSGILLIERSGKNG